ncbi:MAG: hypothetical protein OXS33_13155 [bacterium]|nr:hypothetical protein [bacterium]
MADRMQAHLGMIQGVVNRLAQSSFLLKGWSVVLVSALLAFAANSSEELVLYIALLPSVVFWALDGYFLWQERLFRALYDHVRTQDEASLDYGLDTKSVRDRSVYREAVFSRTISLFHGAILVTILVLIFVMS